MATTTIESNGESHRSRFVLFRFPITRVSMDLEYADVPNKYSLFLCTRDSSDICHRTTGPWPKLIVEYICSVRSLDVIMFAYKPREIHSTALRALALTSMRLLERTRAQDLAGSEEIARRCHGRRERVF